MVTAQWLRPRPRPPHSVATTACAISILLGAGTLQAQGPSSVPCDDCTLQLREFVRLGSLGDGASRDAFSQLAVVPDGFVLAPVLVDRALHLYRSDGTFVRTFRAAGDGPLELNGQVLRLKVDPNNALVVLTSGGRANILSPYLDPISTISLPLPLITDVVRLDGGAVIVSSLIRRDQRMGRALHSVARDGTILASWDPVSMAESGNPSSRRALSPASGGGVWALETTGRTLRRYSDEGQELARVELERPWLTPWQGPEPEFTMEPPKPTVLGIREISGGALVVVTAVADSEWEPTGAGRSIIDLANPGLFDTIVEVFDLSTGATVAYGQFDDRLYLADGESPYVYKLEEQSSGDFRAVVFEVLFE